MASHANVKARAIPHACDQNINWSSSRAAAPDITQRDRGTARLDGEQRAQADAMEAAEQPGPRDPARARDACGDAGHTTGTAARRWHQSKNVSCTLFKVAQKANSLIQ